MVSVSEKSFWGSIQRASSPAFSSGSQPPNETPITRQRRKENFVIRALGDLRGERLSFLSLVMGLWFVALVSGAIGAEDAFKRYVDPANRFTFDYPATMELEVSDADHVKIVHPRASLRIAVVLEKRPRKREPNVGLFFAALKKALEKGETTVLEEGKLPGPAESQGYMICAFKDQRGMRLVQLVQYWVGEESSLQMTISDVPAGFKNLEKVIRKIHQSLRIEKL